MIRQGVEGEIEESRFFAGKATKAQEKLCVKTSPAIFTAAARKDEPSADRNIFRRQNGTDRNGQLAADLHPLLAAVGPRS
jgi:hypothetical protein